MNKKTSSYFGHPAVYRRFGTVDMDMDMRLSKEDKTEMESPILRKPRINAVYGKRRTNLCAAASARTRQVFGASSSEFSSSSPISLPSPPSPVPPIPETPSPRKKTFITRDEFVKENVNVRHDNDEDDDVDGLVEGVGALSIKKEVREERILSPRDVNVVSPALRRSPRKPPANRSGRRLQTTKREEEEEEKKGAATENTLKEHVQPLLNLCQEFNAATGSHAEQPAKLISFKDWASSLDEYFHIVKIAEASYGEVYRLSLKSHNTFTKADESVLKIIALKPPPSVKIAKKKLDAMSSVSSVLSEAQLLRRMTPVPGFTNFRDIRVVRGRPGASFVTAWRHFDKNVKKSDFLDPGRKTSYDDDQLWAVLEMQDAGTDLEGVLERMEAGERACATAVWDVFWGTAIALAKGEEWANFEHRDLHIGNICIRLRNSVCSPALTTEAALEDALILSPPISSPSSSSSKCNLGQSGLETTIIDYTLSRAVLSGASLPGHDHKDDEKVAFFDLAQDSAIFEGDATEEYQYEVYRLMRSTVHGPTSNMAPFSKRKKRPAAAADIKRESEAWRKYHPLTNVVWLHYILTKLCPAPASAGCEPHGNKKMKSSVAAAAKVVAKGVRKKCKDAGTDADLIKQRRLQRLCRLLFVGTDNTNDDDDDDDGDNDDGPACASLACKDGSGSNNSSSSRGGGGGGGSSSSGGDSVASSKATKQGDSSNPKTAAALLFRKGRIQSATTLVEYAVAKGWLDEEEVASCGLVSTSCP